MTEKMHAMIPFNMIILILITLLAAILLNLQARQSPRLRESLCLRTTMTSSAATTTPRRTGSGPSDGRHKSRTSRMTNGVAFGPLEKEEKYVQNF